MTLSRSAVTFIAFLVVLSGRGSSATGQTVKVALTFDDGPDDRPIYSTANTSWKVRQILAANGIHATYFVEHSRINTANGAAQLRAAMIRGHEIGIHGANPYLQHQSWALTTGLLSRFQAMQRIIRSATGRPARFARPPGGESTLAADIRRAWVSSAAIRGPRAVPSGVTMGTIRTALAGAGLTDYVGTGTSGWNSWLTSFTYGTFNPATHRGSVVDEVVKKMDEARAGRMTTRAIILLHDAGGTAPFVAANLQSYINALKRLAAQRGVRLIFGTMSEVAASGGTTTTTSSGTSFVMYRVKVTADNLNIRTSPSTSAARVGSYPYGSLVDVYGVSGSPVWFKVWYGGAWRWIISGYSPKALPSVRITGTGVNVRNGPGTGYARVGGLNAYDVVCVFEARAGWYRIWYNGSWCWIISTYTQSW